MTPRLAAGIAIAILTAAVVALAAQDEAGLVQSPEVLSQSLSAEPLPSAEPTDIRDRLPDESPTTSHMKTDTTQAEPAPLTSTTAARATNSSTTTEPPTASTTTLAPATTTTAQPSGGFNSADEGSFASLINSHRNASGLSALSRNSGLDAEARAWSQQIAANGSLSHSALARFLPPWSSVAENVAVGGSVSSIFGSLTGSPGHNDNMLGNFTHFGIGVWVDSAGTIWTTHVFTR